MTDPDLDPAHIGRGQADGASRLVSWLATLFEPKIIEVGTLRQEPANPTHHTAWAPHGEWTKVDAYPGQDVDIVDDAHHLTMIRPDTDGLGTLFDAYVACSLFEHLERPWVAMQAAAAVVRPGGLVYVQTHQTFPIHGYPSDFFRFSTGALRVIMEDAGLDVLHVGYMYPAKIIPPAEVTRWNPAAEAWLNVEALARKPQEAP